MGNTYNIELSQEELEKFEMQVDEDYNPTGKTSERSARHDYLRKMRERDAAEMM